MTITRRTADRVTVVTIERPERRNAVDLATATSLIDAFQVFDRADDADVAILTGAGGAFCAGADLHALARAIEIARSLAGFPQTSMRNDRLSVYEQYDLSEREAVANEIERGRLTLNSGAMFGQRVASPEFKEAIGAFMARRPADFSGFQ